MQRNRSAPAPVNGRIDSARLLPSAGMSLMLLALTGCSLSPIAKHTVAFNQAARVVINSSENGYAEANRLHREVMVSKAVADYDKNPQWNPYTDVKPLLTTEQLDARIRILDGLKAYSKTMVDLTHPKNAALDEAAGGVGSNLQSLSSTIATSFGGPAISGTAANTISVAVNALAQFLIASKTQKGIKDATQKMDPTITALCELLTSDITVLRRQADVDYQTLITDQDQMIRHAQVDPFTHRDQVGRLVAMATQSQANDELLQRLGNAVHTLGVAHQALTAAAQGKDAETVKQKVVDLSAAGDSLATFYQSISYFTISCTSANGCGEDQ